MHVKDCQAGFGVNGGGCVSNNKEKESPVELTAEQSLSNNEGGVQVEAVKLSTKPSVNSTGSQPIAPRYQHITNTQLGTESGGRIRLQKASFTWDFNKSPSVRGTLDSEPTSQVTTIAAEAAGAFNLACEEGGPIDGAGVATASGAEYQKIDVEMISMEPKLTSEPPIGAFCLAGLDLVMQPGELIAIIGSIGAYQCVF